MLGGFWKGPNSQGHCHSQPRIFLEFPFQKRPAIPVLRGVLMVAEDSLKSFKGLHLIVPLFLDP